MKKIDRFIECVKDNYDTIMSIYKMQYHNLENEEYKFLLLCLKNNGQRLPVKCFSKTIEEYMFFNKMLDLSKKLSIIANNILEKHDEYISLENIMDEYCHNGSEWLAKSSLYSK